LCRDHCVLKVVCFWALVASGDLALLEVAMAQTPYGGGTVQQRPAQTQGNQEVRGSSGGSSLRVIPRVTVSERYDTNVLNIAGSRVSDFVTDIRPGASMEYSNDLVEGVLTGTAMSSVYARHPGLNYLGASVNLGATLDKTTERMVRGLKMNLSEAATYYPESPAFITPLSPESDFTRGIQAVRQNSLTNITTAQSTYQMTPLTEFNASYSFQVRRYIGQPQSSQSGVPIALFNNTVHLVSAGPTYRVSESHTIGTSYVYRQVSIEPASGRSAQSLTSVIHAGVVTWKSILSRELSAGISPGFAIVAGSSDVVWTMRAGLQWQDSKSAAEITYSRNVYPSYFVQAALLISDMVGATYSYRLSSKWRVGGGANYAVNTSTGQLNLRFESRTFNGMLEYSFYPGMTVSATGSHTEFTIDQPGVVAGFNRQIGMVSLTMEWN
jgi:hypothetical protein